MVTAHHLAYLSIGSNIEPERNVRLVLEKLAREFEVVRVSGIYRTPAVGFEGEDFLNMAAIVCTSLSPSALNARLHALETEQGRTREGPRFSSRPLDIDIVLYDDWVQQGQDHLSIPRDDLVEHAFVLGPMAEIAGDVVHPLLKKSLSEIWSAMPAGKKAGMRLVVP